MSESVSSVPKNLGAGAQNHHSNQKRQSHKDQGKDGVRLPKPPVTLSPSLIDLKLGDKIQLHVTGHDAYGRLICTNNQGQFCVEGIQLPQNTDLSLEITGLKPLQALDLNSNQTVLLYILMIKGPVRFHSNEEEADTPPKLQTAPQPWPAAHHLHQASDHGLPIDDADLHGHISSFWQALKTGSAEAWTGTEIRTQFHQEDVSDMWTSLQRDMALLSEMRFEAQGWKPWMFPILQDGKVILLSLFVKQDEFFLEMQSRDHGRMILFGHMDEDRIDIQLQSEKNLPSDLQLKLYENVAEFDQAALNFKTAPVHDPRRAAS